jgi:phage shock protein PspC (stress-responsive transcriptional regulator)
MSSLGSWFQGNDRGIMNTMSENNGHGTPDRQLVRPRQGRMVAGVCAGLAAHFGVDVNLVRLGFAVFTIFWGLGALIYLIAWAVIPEEGEKSIVENLVSKQQR